MITSNHVRTIIREELSRVKKGEPLTESYIQEQSSKGVTGIFSDLFAPFKSFYGGLWKKVSGAFEKEFDLFVKELEKGLGDVDLDLKKPEHRAQYIKGVLQGAEKALAKSIEDLEKASSVKDWTPKSESEEDYKAWKNSEDGKNSDFLFNAHGALMAIADALAPVSESVASVEKQGQGVGSPAAAAEWIVKFLDSLEDVKKESERLEAGADFSKLMSLANTAKNLVKEIAAVMKTSTNEARKSYGKIIKAVNIALREQKEDKDLNIEELEGLQLPPVLKKLLDPDITPAQYAKIDQIVDASGNENHQAFAIAAFILSYADMDEGAANQILNKAKGLVPKIIKARQKGEGK